jgi:Zn-dependent protease with chaperone function
MSKINRSAVTLLLLFAAASLGGCAQHRGPRSAYQAFYQNQLVGVRVPAFVEIATLADEPPIMVEQPVQRVWDVCLGLAAQTKGILGIADDASGGHRLLLISGETLEYRHDLLVFVDRWLAVSARPVAESLTEVRVVFVSPETARVASFVNDRFPDGFKGDSLRSVSLSAREDFILALRKTFAEDEYLRLLRSASQPAVRGVPPTIDIRPMERSESMTKQSGYFLSATIRREKLVLNVQRLEERIAGVVHNLAAVAHQLDKETKVFVVADFMRDVHIEYNGDLFITTRALDEIENVDELAGILSHELAHIYLHHGPLRGKGFKRAGASSRVVISLGALGGALVGGLIPTSKPRSGSPQDSLLSTQRALIGGIVGAGATLLAGQVGTSVGNDVGNLTIERFSRREELEADDYGAELLWAAGYDYRGLLKFLKREGDSKLFEKKGRPAH